MVVLPMLTCSQMSHHPLCEPLRSLNPDEKYFIIIDYCLDGLSLPRGSSTGPTSCAKFTGTSYVLDASSTRTLSSRQIAPMFLVMEVIRSSLGIYSQVCTI